MPDEENRQLRRTVRELGAGRDILHRAALHIAGETSWLGVGDSDGTAASAAHGSVMLGAARGMPGTGREAGDPGRHDAADVQGPSPPGSTVTRTVARLRCAAHQEEHEQDDPAEGGRGR